MNESITGKKLHEQDHIEISLCASFIADPLDDYLKYWSKEFELDVKITFAPYNQVFQQLLDPKSLLNLNTGINILLIRVEDWLRDQKESSASEQTHFLNHTYLTFIEAIKQSRQSSIAPFLIGIVPLSASNSFTLPTATEIAGIISKLTAFLKDIPSFYSIDLSKIANLYEVEEIFDTKSDELGHIPFTQEFYAALGTYLWRKIRAYKTPLYKVIAIDCDNTLWKGICGEDGTLDVIIDKNYGYLQAFLLEKYNEGFLLVLCSKNNENEVWKVFDRHPQMKLKQEHIIAHRINWDAKPKNLISLAEELNVGLDSFIFLDDSNFETEQVSLVCPKVLSLNLPEDSNTFFNFLNHIWEFDRFQVTEEDVQRNKMYKVEKQRKREQVNYEYLDDFLQSLNINVNLKPLNEKDLDRATQLTIRTNQFNLNGIRKTREEIIKAIHTDNTYNQIIDVKDRFGDYGVVGLLLATKIQNTLVINTLLLSCRVLGRNVEEVIMTQLQEYCISEGLDTIIVHFMPTSKNQPFIEFLVRTNWHKDNETNMYSFLINKNQLIAEYK